MDAQNQPATKADFALLRGDFEQFRSEIKDDQSQFRAEIKDDQAQFRAELKEDQAQFRTELKEEHAQFRAEIKEDQAQFRTELKEDRAQFRAEIKEEHAQLRAEMKEDRAQLRTEMSHQYNGMVERIHDSETRLLSAFYSFAGANQRRFVEVEGNEAALRGRIGNIETRLLEVEKRLNLPPAA